MRPGKTLPELEEDVEANLAVGEPDNHQAQQEFDHVDAVAILSITYVSYHERTLSFIAR